MIAGIELDVSSRILRWAKSDEEVTVHRIAGGVERSNRTYRDEVLNAYLFDSLAEVRDLAAEWLDQYTEIRPRDARGRLPPARYRERMCSPPKLQFRPVN